MSANSGLPRGWSSTHDRFIAYLDTHAPLNADGAVPAREWEHRRYSIEEMICMLHKTFPNFNDIVSLSFLIRLPFSRSGKVLIMSKPKLPPQAIPGWTIEKRLVILEAKENNYFNMPYGCYKFEEWGQAI